MKVRTCGLPEITSVMRNLTVYPGDEARFECTVDMRCLVSYIQWFHTTPDNGTRLLLRTGSSVGNPYSFSVTSVRAEDEGVYACVAGNILGETLSSAYLVVSRGVSHFSSTSSIFPLLPLPSLICLG